jgi:hypothetical protein
MSLAQTSELDTIQSRVLDEGYGPGAWHGPDLKAALADVTAVTAFARPAAGRHNIAEIAMHHAYYVRATRGHLTGVELEPFALAGEDWFPLDGTSPLTWQQIKAVLETEQRKLADVVAGIAEGRIQSPLPSAERFALVLGITCHAVYHAGQAQLVRRLISEGA